MLTITYLYFLEIYGKAAVRLLQKTCKKY